MLHEINVENIEMSFWSELLVKAQQISPIGGDITYALRVGGVTSADAAYRYLKPLDPSITRSEVRTAWKDINQATGYRGPLMNLPLGARVPSAWITPTTAKLHTKYLVAYGVEHLDIHGNVISTSVACEGTDVLPTYGPLSEEMDDTVKRQKHPDAVAVRPVGIIGVKKRI